MYLSIYCQQMIDFVLKVVYPTDLQSKSQLMFKLTRIQNNEITGRGGITEYKSRTPFV